MLRIYPVLLQLVRDLQPLVRQLERHDADLARQCRKALASAPLNVAEGSYNRRGLAERDLRSRSREPRAASRAAGERSEQSAGSVPHGARVAA